MKNITEKINEILNRLKYKNLPVLLVLWGVF